MYLNVFNYYVSGKKTEIKSHVFRSKYVVWYLTLNTLYRAPPCQYHIRQNGQRYSIISLITHTHTNQHTLLSSSSDQHTIHTREYSLPPNYDDEIKGCNVIDTRVYRYIVLVRIAFTRIAGMCRVTADTLT